MASGTLNREGMWHIMLYVSWTKDATYLERRTSTGFAEWSKQGHYQNALWYVHVIQSCQKKDFCIPVYQHLHNSPKWGEKVTIPSELNFAVVWLDESLFVCVGAPWKREFKIDPPSLAFLSLSFSFFTLFPIISRCWQSETDRPYPLYNTKGALSLH